jgi:hypothetical protein
VSTSDLKYFYAYIAYMTCSVMALLFSVYLMLWVSSFINTGELANEDEAQDVFSKITLFSFVGMLLSLPILSALVDRSRPNIIVPLAFLLRGLSILTFLVYIKTPYTFGVNFVCFSIVLFGMLENISVTTLFLKGMPNDIRGTMLGALHFFGQIG